MTPGAAVIAADAGVGGQPPSDPPVPVLGLRRTSSFVPELESLRGWAILFVVCFHVDGYARYPFSVRWTAPLPIAYVAAGHTGVDLFFVLSAFLLSQPFLADAAGGRRLVLRDYFARRALRILPLYWLAVTVATVCTSTRSADLARGLPYLVFLNSFAGTSVLMNPWGSTWWSLATEVQFYLVLPVLLLLRYRVGRVVLGMLLVAWVVTYVRMVNGPFRMSSAAAQLALQNSVFGRAPLFLVGIGAAAVYRRWGDGLRTRLAGVGWLRNGGADVILAALIVGLGTFLQWVVSIGPTGQQSTAGQPWHAANGMLWAVLLLVLLVAPLRTKALFSNALLARLGILSYSIYLIHAPLVFLSLQAVRRAYPGRFNGWQATTASVIAVLAAACVGVASLTYRYVEQPFLVRKARFDS